MQGASRGAPTLRLVAEDSRGSSLSCPRTRSPRPAGRLREAPLPYEGGKVGQADVAATEDGDDGALESPSRRVAAGRPPPTSRRSARSRCAPCPTGPARHPTMSLVGHRQHLVHERLHVQEVQRRPAARPSGRPRCSSPTASVIGHAPPPASCDIFRGALGLDAHHADGRVTELDRGRHARDQPAPRPPAPPRCVRPAPARAPRGLRCPAPR